MFHIRLYIQTIDRLYIANFDYFKMAIPSRAILAPYFYYYTTTNYDSHIDLHRPPPTSATNLRHQSPPTSTNILRPPPTSATNLRHRPPPTSFDLHRPLPTSATDLHRSPPTSADIHRFHLKDVNAPMYIYVVKASGFRPWGFNPSVNHSIYIYLFAVFVDSMVFICCVFQI